MRSYRVLKPLVERLGLQAGSPNRDWIVKKVFRRYWETWQSEKGMMLEDRDGFTFSDVRYDLGETFRGVLRIEDQSCFTLYSADQKTQLGEGHLGTSLVIQDPPLQITVASFPKKMKKGGSYPIQVLPWAAVAGDLRKEIKIANDKDNKSLIHISVSHRDRFLAARIVNELMNEYQAYLKREYDEVAQEQIHYLDQKQEQIFAKMDQLFDTHMGYLSDNLKTGGFLALEGGADVILAPHHEMDRRLTEIELEISLIDQFSKEGKLFAFKGGPLYELDDYRQQRDLLELSLIPSSEKMIEFNRDELQEIRTLRSDIDRLIQKIDLGQEIASFEGDQALYLWAKNVRDSEEKEDFVDYLENYARLLSMREKMLKERLYYGNYPPSELDGIDLDSARGLFLGYNTKLDQAEASICHYERFKKELHRPDFDLASLSGILSDALCQKIIADASKLSLQLKDEKHCTAKEISRWIEEIALQKKILADQLDQLIKVEELNATLIRQKMSALQKVSLDCLNQKISVLDEQSFEGMKKKRESLLLEKELLERKIGDARHHLASALPEKLRYEKWLQIKTEMLNRVMGSVAQVAESKSISAHLHHVESKPLDPALTPSAPQKPQLIRMMLGGGFLLPFAFFVFAFIRQLLKGFPSSLDKLKALGFPILGEISTFCDGPLVDHPTGPDLDLLRQMALFAEGSKVISLIGGKGPDYSFALAENLARISRKSIILRCDFQSKFQKEDAPGILQLWKGETGELPIRKGRGFDYLMAGGYTPFGTEIIQSQNFTTLLELLKKKYDSIFLLFRSPLPSAESSAALRISDKAIVTVSGEATEVLTPFIDWAYHKDSCRLTFITRA